MSKHDDLPSVAEARTELQRGLRLWKAFEHADKALAVLESVDQLTRERDQAAAKALAESEAATAEMLKAKEELATAKAECKRITKNAKDTAASKVANAEMLAAEMVKTAEDRVAALKAEEEAMAAELLSKDSELRALQGKLDEARSIIDRAAKAREALAGV